MTDDALFTVIVERALGDCLETLMTKAVAAMKRDDNELRLFDVVVEQALGDSLEELMMKAVAAMQRGNLERLRLIDLMVASAVQLGTHAVVAAQSERNNQ